MIQREQERVVRVATLLRHAERPVRVLRTLAWGPEVKERFFAAGARELPVPSYVPVPAEPVLQGVTEARRFIRGGTLVDDWLLRQAKAIETGARMLAAVGTPEFSTQSARLYGRPTDPLPDGLGTSLQLAHQFDDVLGSLDSRDLGAPPDANHDAEGVACEIRRAVSTHFGADAPEVAVVDALSANALAGPRSIRIRQGARFTDRDVVQLIQHEAFIHVGTSLNGLQQKHLPILAAGHPGTTRTQEGLAVFAEFISGAMDVDRLQRLADRVMAINMALEGADFLQIYEFFARRTASREQAFENARRVFRGGVLSGGAPFTKDQIYLDGFVRVHSFLRSVVAAGNTRALRLLFCGKLDVQDIPALSQLAAVGLCTKPPFVPPWVSDLRYLVSYLAYTNFLSRIHTREVEAQCGEWLEQAMMEQQDTEL